MLVGGFPDSFDLIMMYPHNTPVHGVWSLIRYSVGDHTGQLEPPRSKLITTDELLYNVCYWHFGHCMQSQIFK